MRVLVTGASGFLGSWLGGRLQDRGHAVVGFDRLIRPEIELTTWYEGDITDLEALTAAIQGCQAVIHLAVLPQYRSEQDPAADLQVNVLGTLQALRAARAVGIQRFLLASSSTVYGAAAGCLAEDAPAQPLTPYGASKLAAETYCGLFARAYDLPTTILRFFQIYGRHDDGRLRITVEGQFLRAVLAGHPPTLLGDPNRAYDFVHVDDVLRALVLALEADLPPGLILNVGSGQATRLGDLAAWCCEAAGIDQPPLLLPGPDARPPHYADLTRAAHYLGYAPQHDLRTWVFATVRSALSPSPPERD